MDGWFFPFPLSACYHAMGVTASRNGKNVRMNYCCLTPKCTIMRTLKDPTTVIGSVGKNETLTIEAHGKFQSDTIMEFVQEENKTLGKPTKSLKTATDVAKYLKQFKFRGGNIRLHVCYSAEKDSFGSHLRKALVKEKVKFKSLKGQKGQVNHTKQDVKEAYYDVP